MKLLIILTSLIITLTAQAWTFQINGAKTKGDPSLCSGKVPIVNSYDNPKLFRKYFSGKPTHKMAFNSTAGREYNGILNGNKFGKTMKCATQDQAKKSCGPRSKSCNSGFHCVRTYYADNFKGRCLKKK